MEPGDRKVRGTGMTYSAEQDTMGEFDNSSHKKKVVTKGLTDHYSHDRQAKK